MSSSQQYLFGPEPTPPRGERGAQGEDRRERRVRARIDDRDRRPPREPVPVRRSRTPFTGWRAWRLVERSDGPLLLSLAVPAEWHGPVLAADVDPASGPHGIHAFNSRTELDRMTARGDVVVFGQVTLFGSVAVHELGYRAERCRIDRLWLAPCGRHQVARCNCRPPAGAPGWTLLWLLSHRCHTRQELRLPSGRYVGPPFRDDVLYAYCRCRLADETRFRDAALDDVAEGLSSRYQCDASVLPVAGRSYGLCTFLHRVRDGASSTRGAPRAYPQGGSHGQDR